MQLGLIFWHAHNESVIIPAGLMREQKSIRVSGCIFFFLLGLRKRLHLLQNKTDDYWCIKTELIDCLVVIIEIKWFRGLCFPVILWQLWRQIQNCYWILQIILYFWYSLSHFLPLHNFCSIFRLMNDWLTLSTYFLFNIDVINSKIC